MGKLEQLEKLSGNILIKNSMRLSLLGKDDNPNELFKELILEANNNIKYVDNPNYNKCLDYLYDNKGKGLAIFGDVGTGKTDFVKIIINYLLYEKYKKLLFYIEARTLTPQIIEIFQRKKTPVAIDDIGMEQQKYNYLIQYIIDIAYNNSILLYVTSNLSRNEFANIYGNAALDRLEYICKIVEFKGESLRKRNML